MRGTSSTPHTHSRSSSPLELAPVVVFEAVEEEDVEEEEAAEAERRTSHGRYTCG
jgi:hypothetical protein